MAEVKKELEQNISGLAIRNADKCVDFHVGLLLNITSGVEDGDWSETKYPDSFDKLRKILQQNKDWYVMQTFCMQEIRNIRKDLPRTHWWWWIEEV